MHHNGVIVSSDALSSAYKPCVISDFMKEHFYGDAGRSLGNEASDLFCSSPLGCLVDVSSTMILHDYITIFNTFANDNLLLYSQIGV